MDDGLERGQWVAPDYWPRLELIENGEEDWWFGCVKGQLFDDLGFVILA